MSERIRTPDAANRFPLLVVWTLLGLGGCAMIIGGGLASDWPTYFIGLAWAVASIFMLGTGLWMRWPRG